MEPEGHEEQGSEQGLEQGCLRNRGGFECREEQGSLRFRRNQDNDLKRPPNFVLGDPHRIAKELAFTTKRKEPKVNELICEIKNALEMDRINEDEEQMEDIKNSTKELGDMITTDPRLCDLLDMDFLKLLLLFLKRDPYPHLQVYIAAIFKPFVIYSCNEDVVGVIRSVTPIVMNLINSRVSMVQVEALWLLRNLLDAISKLISKFNTEDLLVEEEDLLVEEEDLEEEDLEEEDLEEEDLEEEDLEEEDLLVEEALHVITSLIMRRSIGYGVFYAACVSLLGFCENFPKFSSEKLKLVVPALIKLIESNVTIGCRGLALLCDGREEMVVDDADLDCLIGRLVLLMNSPERAMVISALNAMRSIARWGTDAVIETIIKKDGALLILSILLNEDDMYIVKQTCWILTNITARKEKHIRAVVDGELIGPLVHVVESCELSDVREVAVWALSNALSGVSLDQIECLRNSCSKVSWPRLLLTILHDNLCILVTLEGLVNIKVAKVTWDGRPIDGVELHSIFKKIMHDGELIRGSSVYDAQTSASGTMEYSRILFESEFSGHKLTDRPYNKVKPKPKSNSVHCPEKEP
ncbi:hypothetical protein POM88_038601 [Heracleum sosnowskyi]|uniref:Importin subunit alpha n=1 Tax=Heracleum sosnowskyi TaxID=360622 RepID=A0AAD8HBJ1_9APIA|nr:hypothetical protein POM88_038601 [Heracleum sosnowskyi]